jgi:two-component system cell cycle response regulator
MRIVLVDQSRTIIQIVTSLIQSDGHEVIGFSDGRKALDFIVSNPDVRALITSGQIESMSGLELCEAARKLAGTRRALYIILMSSSDDHGIVVQALDRGADDFLRKPPITEELRARLRAADRLTSMQHELIRYATTDFLTGLFNRREFFHRAMEAIGEVLRGTTLSAVMFDIDHFKRVNDKYGHEAGDRALTAVASVVKEFDGISGRLGGEEFCLLTRHEQARAMEIAEDLRCAISDVRFKTGCREIGVTCSLGVAEWQPGNTIDALLQRSDMALYLAKKGGRNRVTAADHQPNWGSDTAWRSVVRTDAERIQ